MIPLETTHQFPINEKVFEFIKSYENHPFGKALHVMALHYQQFYIEVANKKFSPYHDPVTIHYLLYPEDFEVEPVRIEVDCGKTSYGRTNCYFGKNEVKNNTFVTKNLTGSL